MNILITGGAGFIGSHLCERFLKEGNTVFCLDNLLTGSLRNIEPLMDNSSFRFIEHDITFPFDLKEKLDQVLHFASPASPVDYQELPLETLRVGSLGTFNALELARQKGAGFLLASTSEVYGDPAISPQPETYWGQVNPIGPRSVYDEAKRFAEAATMAYRRSRGLRAKIIRIFNTYGPRMRRNDGRVVPNFIDQSLQGKPFTIYGDGRQTRSFCYIDDLVEGICRVIKTELETPVNLGNPNEFTMLELAQVVAEVAGVKLQLLHQPLPVDDPKQRRPDIAKAKKELGWEPQVQLKEGIRRTLEFYKAGG